ncbi:DNA methylase (plasmid) [Psychrobacter urativorans]|uniref:site-specific DNA-methyltransferase (adenine-specific) n=2 Tax=Psychrobacter urativorans TaxID=45610 RepID=A0A0M5TIU6_9GAMM|nr:site-specific DNA-methyltransferase [Psychrobacter urativorans]ALF60948.1 DNA methylase [Psychrobacter urativorans]ALF60950.1 DNA methylase [Psychrobacter urativorans]
MPILNWLNKEEAVTTARDCPYRLLEQVPALSYGETYTDNMLIQGDNLEALKALIPTHAGRVKCIFIDPPYNTKSAFEHYDDNLEHSKWLSMMYPRLELLHKLLAEDGSIWITLNDNEAHYFKVMMDEIFGRSNFVANFIWQKKFSPQNDAKYVSDMHDHMFCYAKHKSDFKIKKWVDINKKDRAKNLDNDSRGDWNSVDYTCNKNKVERPNLYYGIIQPNTGETIYPKETAVWRYSQETHNSNVENDLVYWGKTGKNKVPRFKKFKSEEKQEDEGSVPISILFHTEVGNTQEAKKECILFNARDPFSTPKPERLLQRVIHLSSNEGDIVLDSFLGSATTAAVAQKMNRKFIGVELGEQAVTHCQPRLRQVVDGEKGGVSKAVDWKGGGGFEFYRLGEIIFNETGSLNKDISFHSLAAHIWYGETKTSLKQQVKSPLLGVYNDVAYYLLYNGILGDKRPDGGNVLTSKVLAMLPKHPLEPKNGKKVIYGETSRMGTARLKSENIIFKQIPYDVKGK